MMEVMTLDLVRSLSFFLSCWRILETPTTLLIQENGSGELISSIAKCIWYLNVIFFWISPELFWQVKYNKL